MITSLLCLAFPLLLIYAAWHDVSTMTIPNWVSIVLGLTFIPAAFAAGLSVEQIGMHLVFGACAVGVRALLSERSAAAIRSSGGCGPDWRRSAVCSGDGDCRRRAGWRADRDAA
jgi:prepilin peptidase CpaA